MSSCRLIVLIVSSCFILISSAESQFDDRHLNQTGYSHLGTDFWASGGAGIAERGIAGAAFANPALLSFDAPTARVEFDWQPSTHYVDFFKYQYDNTLALPSYASVGFPLGPYNFEAGYARTYNERFSLSHVEYITYTAGNGANYTGQYVDVINTAVVHTAFVAASFALPENISFGLMLGEDFIRYESSSVSAGVQTGSRLRFSVGGNARLSKNVDVALAAAIIPKNYSGTSFVPLPVITQAPSPATPPANPGPPLVMILPTSYFSWQSPSSVTVGTRLEVLPWLGLLGSAEYQMWSAGVNLTNQLQFHAGGIAAVGTGITVRLGFFTQNSAYGSGNEYPGEDFLTGGISWSISQNLSASFAYLTSAPFTRTVAYSTFQSLHQQVLSGGVSYSW